MQRCAAHLASKVDVEEAFEAGRHAVLAAVSGQTDYMVAYERKPGDKYEVEYKLVPLTICANTEKKVPQEWIINDGTAVYKAQRNVGLLECFSQGKRFAEICKT